MFEGIVKGFYDAVKYADRRELPGGVGSKCIFIKIIKNKKEGH